MTKKIFLVDDEPINNAIHKKVLDSVEPAGHYLDFSDPRKAFDALATEQPDLIFLDLSMPFMTGWDFLDRMAAAGMQHKVVILTSSYDDADIAHGSQFPNVIRFMHKPIQKDLFIAFFKSL